MAGRAGGTDKQARSTTKATTATTAEAGKQAAGASPIGRTAAVIGLGMWGKNILRNLDELGALKTACDSDAAALAARREKLPGIAFTTDPEAVFADPDIKAVAIAASSPQHYPLAKRALLAGKDVFVEKPMALTYREGAELVGLARQGGRILMVGHILQFHPAVIKLKEMVAAGELGRLEYLYSNRLNIGTLRTEENIWWSFAPHDISVILSIVGEEPARIHAFGGDYLRKGNFDTTLVDMDFARGVKAHIFVSWLHPFKEQKLVVVGSKAMAVFDDTADEKLLLYPHRIEWQDGRIPLARKAEYVAVPLPWHEPLKAELSHFLECCATRSRPRTDGEEGLRVTGVLERAQDYLAAHAGRMSQALPDLGIAPKVFRGDAAGAAISGSAALSGAPRPGVHPSAVIDEGAILGAGTKVWHFSHVLPGTVIGSDCVLGQNVMAGPRVRIGNRVKIQNNVSVYEGVELGDGVFVGPSVVFTNVVNPRAFVERKHEFRRTVVGEGATLGANATLVCGVTVGEYALVAAGAVVTRDVAPHALVAGVPARRMGWVCRCGTTLRFTGDAARCAACGLAWAIRAGRLGPADGAPDPRSRPRAPRETRPLGRFGKAFKAPSLEQKLALEGMAAARRAMLAADPGPAAAKPGPRKKAKPKPKAKPGGKAKASGKVEAAGRPTSARASDSLREAGPAPGGRKPAPAPASARKAQPSGAGRKSAPSRPPAYRRGGKSRP